MNEMFSTLLKLSSLKARHFWPQIGWLAAFDQLIFASENQKKFF